MLEFETTANMFPCFFLRINLKSDIMSLPDHVQSVSENGLLFDYWNLSFNPGALFAEA